MSIKWVPNMSIFDHPPHVALVNPVNCKGVMGAGLARDFAEKYPAMFCAYKRRVEIVGLSPGGLTVWAGSVCVVGFATKDHWRGKSKLAWIEHGLRRLGRYVEANAGTPYLGGATELAVPMLGCGHGGLAWQNVCPLVVSYLGSKPITVWVHGKEM